MDWSVFDRVNVVDLTHPLSPETPVFPGDPAVSLASGPAQGTADGWHSLVLSASDHAGTHLDAPRHFFGEGLAADRLTGADLIRPGVMIDVREECLDDEDHRIGMSAIEAWEKQHGWIPPGSVVIFQTGWSFRWPDPARYLPHDEGGTLHTPGLGAEAAEWLVRERRVRAVGIDGPSIDVGRSSTFPTHRMLLGAGCYVLENLANVYQLPEHEFRVFVGALKLVGGTGAPCRVLALVPRS